LRRSTLVALDLADVEFVSEGLVLSVRREKQDQRSKGRKVGVAYGRHMQTCPVEALQTWLRFRGNEAGPLYLPVMLGNVGTHRLHPGVVARVVKEAARGAGLEPANFAGHSLRSGFVTAAVDGKASLFTIAQHTGHRSLSSLRRYFRRGDAWEANLSAAVGL
jgi:integrase